MLNPQENDDKQELKNGRNFKQSFIFLVLVFLVIQFSIFPYEIYTGTKYYQHHQITDSNFTLVDAGHMKLRAIIPWVTLSPLVLYGVSISDPDNFAAIGGFFTSLIWAMAFLFFAVKLYNHWLRNDQYRKRIALGVGLTIILSSILGYVFYDANYYKRDVVYAQAIQKLKDVSGKDVPFPENTHLKWVQGTSITYRGYNKAEHPVQLDLYYDGSRDSFGYFVDGLSISIDFLSEPGTRLTPDLCNELYSSDVGVSGTQAVLVKNTVYHCLTPSVGEAYIGYLDSSNTIMFKHYLRDDAENPEGRQRVMEFLNFYLKN